MKNKGCIFLTAVLIGAISMTAGAQELGEKELPELEDVFELEDDAFDEDEAYGDGSIFGDEDLYEQDEFYTEEDWQQAYLGAMKEAILTQEGYTFSLIYVDEDDIPELVCNSGVEAGGCQIYTWHDGMMDVLQTTRLGYTYIDSENLLNNCGGHMGGYFDLVYTIEDGMWVQVAQGTYFIDTDGTESYVWEGQEVAEEEYDRLLSEVYDSTLAQSPDVYHTYEELCSFLDGGEIPEETVIGDHRYEIVRKDVSWSEAQAECEEKGGYLAAITTQEEFDQVADLIREAGCQKCFVWVGGSQKYSTRQGYYWLAPEEEYNMLDANYLSWWLQGEPSYRGLSEDGTEMEEDSVAMISIQGRFCLNDAPDDVLLAAPSYSGIIAYVCEYDN